MRPIGRILSVLFIGAMAPACAAPGPAPEAAPPSSEKSSAAPSAAPADDTVTPDSPAPARSDLRAARFDEIARRLSLSDDQKPDVQRIMDDSMKARQALLAELGIELNGVADLDRRQKFKLLRSMRDIRQKQDAALEKILTPSQLADYQTFMTEQRDELRALMGADRTP